MCAQMNDPDQQFSQAQAVSTVGCVGDLHTARVTACFSTPLATAWQQIESLTRPASRNDLPTPLLAILDWFMPAPDGPARASLAKQQSKTS